MTLVEDHLIKIQNSIEFKEKSKDVFFLLEKAFQETIGHKLFTILKFEKNTFMLERIYTNEPKEYPTYGMKILKKRKLLPLNLV